MVTGCWAFVIINANIRRTSIGNKYQLHWFSALLNSSNESYTISPNSHVKNIITNEKNAKNIILNRISELNPCFDFEMRGKNWKINLWNLNIFFMKNKLLISFQYSTSSNCSDNSKQLMDKISHMNNSNIMYSWTSLNRSIILNENRIKSNSRLYLRLYEKRKECAHKIHSTVSSPKNLRQHCKRFF